MKNCSGLYPAVQADAAGAGVVSDAGGVALLETVRAAGLDRGLGQALGPWRKPTADALLADKAYSSRAHRALLRARGIKAVIPERADQQQHRHNRGSAGGRPVSYDTEQYKGRNVVERSYEQFKQWRGLATRYDKLAVVRGGAILRSVILGLKSPLGDTP